MPKSTPAEKKRSAFEISTGSPTSSALAMRHAPALNARRFFLAPGMNSRGPKFLRAIQSGMCFLKDLANPLAMRCRDAGSSPNRNQAPRSRREHSGDLSARVGAVFTNTMSPKH